MTLIRAAADLHGHLPDIEPCDLLVLAGDRVPPELERDLLLSRAWLAGPFAAYLHRVAAEVVVAVAGNHDRVFAEQLVPSGLPRFVYLEDEEVTVECGGRRLRVYGTPWTPTWQGWAFEAPEQQLARTFDRIPTGLDLLVAHTPPHLQGDRAPTYGTRDPAAWSHVGSRALSWAVRRAQPRLCCYGHVHEDGGYIGQLGRSCLVNAALLDGYYVPVRQPIELRLD